VAPTQKQRDSSGTLIRLRYQKIGTRAHNGNKNFSWSQVPKHSWTPGTAADSPPAQTLLGLQVLLLTVQPKHFWTPGTAADSPAQTLLGLKVL